MVAMHVARGRQRREGKCGASDWMLNDAYLDYDLLADRCDGDDQHLSRRVAR